MKVNQSTSNQVQSPDAKGAGKAQAAKGADKASKTAKTEKPDARVDNGDTKTELSDRAREMAQAKSIASDAPDVREDKIAALKARIASGEYKVNHEAVADRMVDEHLRSGIG